MEIRDLTIFVTVARTGSITKAAGQLGYVQSNVTARIQHLETSLGTVLFHRHPRGVSPTAMGEVFLRYAERILHLCEEAEQAVRDNSSPSGPLRIGAMETTAAIRLPAILSEYHKLYSKVQISLLTGPTEHLVEKTLNFEIEGAFVAGPVHHPLLTDEATIQEELVLVSKPGDDIILDPKELSSRNLVVFREGCSYRKRLEQWLDAHGIGHRTVVELGSVDGILGCVAAGLGISLVPRSIIRNEQHDLSVHELPDGYGKVPTVFIRRKDAFLSPALAKFIAVVRKHVEADRA
ncbi:LysR family transcriptional regulator [Kyrpidia spormannii]|uniref:Transcriptional regulator (LysR family) n=1 Tax=Kyrpidia spormannii TaxID=2055160 RepID=A0ACA8ZDJ3_9BACL|nr:LysR family transcriptional regulator [Kyrpidia spormannii]CAB3395012.1 transcriptional regulator (LysR family) [Kyrpidia spormannii]